MVYPKSGWLHKVIQGAIAASVVAVVAVGCASSPPAPSGAAEEGMVQTLGDVSVSREGGDSVILLEGLANPIYSVSRPDDSNLIVIDLVGVSQSGAASSSGDAEDEARQIAAYDGVVDLITLATFDEDGDTPLTRLEIVMAAEGFTEVLSTEAGLEIRVILAEGGADMAAAEDASDDFMAETEAEDAMVSEPWGVGDGQVIEGEGVVGSTVDVVAMAPPPAASMLTELSAEITDGGVLVALQADGAIESLEAFTLSDPARLVIDLPGLTVGEGIANLKMESTLVTGVRLGSHDGKVRVVLDGGSDVDDFQGRLVMPGTTGLWIAIGEGEALEQAMADALDSSEEAWLASAEPVSEEMLVPSEPAVMTDSFLMDETEEVAFESEVVPVEESLEESAATEDLSMATFELAEVYGLHYERTDGMDRTAILADEAIQYTMTTPDETTVVISLPSSQISKDASDRIFPAAGGPISLIHAFQQPDVEVPEVRVVFTRAPNLTPVISRRGSMLFVDFEDMGVAAAPPPAFPNAGMNEDGTSSELNLVSVDALESSASDGSDAIDEEALLAQAAGFSPDSSATAGTAVIEVDSELPNFDAELEVASLPAALDAKGSVWDAPMDAPGAPAAVEVPAAIEVLEEGGLIDGKEYRGRRVSLDFKDVEIADVLRLIAEVSDLNIIAGDEVAGNVTIRLVEVPWDQALDVILMTKGLGFVRVGNVLRIAPTEVLKAEEEVRLQERRNKEKLEDLEVKLLPVNYAAVKDVVGLVKRLLSARGTVNMDERTNTLIIKDISSVIDEASALIAAIDTQTPQVMIEAKIVEANLGFSRELGSVWSIQTQQWQDPFNPGTPREDLGSEDLRWIDDNALSFANPITAVPNGLATIGALILNEDFRIDAQIQAAESSGDGKVVSSPRIVTLDNKQAKIEQGVSIPFQTFEGGDAKLEFIDAVLSLTVTPHITADESIIMEIEVTRNSPDDSVQTPTGSPAIAKNVAETETLVKDGQTLVLGGIYTIIKTRRQSRVPYLWRIPVIGNMFKMNSITDARKELLVFVTPRIIRLPEMARN